MLYGSSNVVVSIMKKRMVQFFILISTNSNLTQRFKVFKQDSGSNQNTNNVFVIFCPAISLNDLYVRGNLFW